MSLDFRTITDALRGLFGDSDSLTGLALQLAGQYAQSRAHQAVTDRQGELTAAEINRQRALDQQRQQGVTATQANFTPANQAVQQQDMAERLRAQLTPPSAAAGDASYSTSNPGAPAMVNDSLSARLALALDRGKQHAANTANVGAIGRVNMNNQVGLNRLGETTGQLNRTGANSANILPMELAAARSAGNRWATGGDITGGLGALMTMNAQAQQARRNRYNPLTDPNATRDWGV